MKIEYTGRHIEVTPALKSHVENHFNRIAHLFNGDNTKANIIIEVGKAGHRSEVILKWKDHVLTADSVVGDMYKSLTKTVDKIEKQALKLRKKVIDKHHKATKASTVAVDKDEVLPMPESPEVIETKQYSIKPLTIEEAVLRLKADENRFLVYRDSETERISVIYNRKDGNYGLITP
jgi:putative sigma-54 modulation protein